MRKPIMLLFAALIAAIAANAQYNTPENTIWTFGDSAAVSFATGAPVAIPSSLPEFSPEACASVCDAAGNLLFYTEGTNIYNATHTLMPHGSSFTFPWGAPGITQGAAIVPMPGRPDKYYLFSLCLPFAGTTNPSCKLLYSVVDMTLDGGLGDLTITAIDTSGADSLSEKMITVRGDNCNIWLVLHKRSIPAFVVYNITPAGISAPTTYSLPGSFISPTAFQQGVMKISHDRQTIVSQSLGQGPYGAGFTEIFDFNTATGAVSNRRLLDSSDQYNPYGAEFSPDNTKLYSYLNVRTTTTSDEQIWQYDLTLPTTAAISASKTVIKTFYDTVYRDMKLAPDNKIYVAAPRTSYLHCIPSPNTTGTGCGFINNAVSLDTGVCLSGLPNTVQVPVLHYDTTTVNIHLCRPSTGYVTLTPPMGGGYYLWYDSSSAPTHTVSASGTYWVLIYDDCDVHSDTFHVVLDTLPPVFTGNDTTINNGDEIVLTASPTGGSYSWSTGTMGDTIHVSAAGTYWVEAQNGLCTVRDTIVVYVTTGVASVGHDITAAAYPNPAHDRVTIATNGLQGSSARVYISNMTGLKVAEQLAAISDGVLTAQMDIQNLRAGVYVIRIEDHTGNHIMQKLTVY